MAVKIKDIDRGWKRIERDIKVLKGCEVKSGLMGNDSVNGVSVIDYAAYNEFGTSMIPARPFMSKTYDENIKETNQRIDFMAGQLLDGKIKPKQLLNRLGLYYSNKIKMTIRKAKQWAVPNTKRTIKAKGSSSPLIDTGRMVGAVNFEITIGNR